MRHRRKGLLSRLRRDIRGNTLALVGAGLVPLTAIIGSGVDMSRAYMAKTRLQSACDAAALAGRRVMSNDSLTQAVTDEANRFFRFNFPQGLYDTASFTPTVTRPETGTVRVAASTTIPTTVMRMFGFTNLPLNVTCDATLSFVNTDVMLVLDVTGSMAQSLGGTPKIDALRDAVMALYDELAPIQAQLEANGMRLRYGIVPYSSTVNVGALIREADPDYLADNVSYRSRQLRYETPVYEGVTGPPEDPVVQVYGSSISQSDCDRYGRNRSFGSFNPSATNGGGPPPATTWTRTYSNNESSGVDWGWSGASDTSGTSRSCRRRYVQTDTNYPTPPRYGWTQTIYDEEVIDVSSFKLGNAVTYMSRGTDLGFANGGTVPEPGQYDGFDLVVGAEDMTTTPVTWNGCIEERGTVDDIRYSSGTSAPDGAHDLDINLIPDEDDDATRWRPMIPQLYWRSNGGGSYSQMSSTACPAASKRLQAWSRTAMESYINGLQPTGNTYHDIGMIWGARLISSAGIFADSADTFNGMPVTRHIIFMTDGQLEPSSSVYSSYGVETNDRRVTGSSTATGQYESHMQRFRMACNAAKNLSASVWVIAFGTTLSADMQNCASNANQAFTSADRDQLIARFREIGANIGALRLTQ